jgi:hypothetical protein
VRLGRVAAAFVLGLLASAYFWVPAFVDKELVKVDLLREGGLEWRLHGLSVGQLFYGRWGFGLSEAGPHDGMSFSLGPVHLGLAALGLLLVVGSGRRRRKALFMALAVMAAVGAGLATNLSAPLWELLPPLQYLAFPWRTLMLPALALPILALPLLARLRTPALLLVLGLVVVVGLPRTEPQGFLPFDDEFYLPQSIAEKGLNTTTREEYEPRWVQTRPPYYEQGLVSADADVSIRELTRRTTRQEYLVTSAAPTVVETATFYYPGWRVTVDGVERPPAIVPVRGTMALAVPAGSRLVALSFDSTPLRRAAVFVSLFAWLLLIAGFALGGWRRRQPIR